MSEVGDAAALLARALALNAGALEAVATASNEAEDVRGLQRLAFGESSRSEEPLRALDRALDALDDVRVDLIAVAGQIEDYAAEVLGLVVQRGPGPSLSFRTLVTHPSRSPNPDARPRGEPESAPRGARVRQIDLDLQNSAARVLAAEGYDVEQLARDPTRKSPDFRVEGMLFDCYTPEKDTPLDNIRVTVRRKARSGQADRFVVNLDRSPLTASDLARLLMRKPSRRVREVLIVKNGRVSRAWPPGSEGI